MCRSETRNALPSTLAWTAPPGMRWNPHGGIDSRNKIVLVVVKARSNESVQLGERCPASIILAGWRQSVLPIHLLGLPPLLGCVGAVAGDVKL